MSPLRHIDYLGKYFDAVIYHNKGVVIFTVLGKYFEAVIYRNEDVLILIQS